jgi:hypothetical protein
MGQSQPQQRLELPVEIAGKVDRYEYIHQPASSKNDIPVVSLCFLPLRGLRAIQCTLYDDAQAFAATPAKTQFTGLRKVQARCKSVIIRTAWKSDSDYM